MTDGVEPAEMWMSKHKIALTTPEVRAVTRMLNEKLCGPCDTFSKRELDAINRVLDKLIAVEIEIEIEIDRKRGNGIGE